MNTQAKNKAAVPAKKKKTSPMQVTMRRLFRNPSAVAGIIILALLLLMAVTANFIRPYDPNAIDMTIRNQAPNAKHWFGTDSMGRDILSRIMVGAKYSLSLGVLNSTFSCIIGLILGSMCGYFGGKVDLIVMRFLDIVQAIPGMLLGIALASVLGAGFWQTILAIGIAGAPGFARMIRASVMSVRGTEYIEASVLINCTTRRTIIHHVLPNAISPILVQFTMSIASCIIMAASLSFIGLGVQPPTPEWGAMLSGAKELFRDHPYQMIVPGFFIMITVLAINLVGDALRDAMDPKLRK
ncbi:MAG: ABC transporter permease [Faecousia sp.]